MADVPESSSSLEGAFGQVSLSVDPNAEPNADSNYDEEEWDTVFTLDPDPDVPLNLIADNMTPPGLTLFSTEYVLANQSLNTELGPRGRFLLQSLGQVQRGEIQGYHLGRMMRTSTENQRVLGRLIVRFIDKIRADPSLYEEYSTVLSHLARIQQYSVEHNSMFEEMPPEIRRMIYKLALTVDKWIEVKSCKHGHPTTYPHRARRPVMPMLSLIYTSRMIYEEAAPIYYELNKFTFGCCCALAQNLKPDIAVAFNNITRIEFNFLGPVTDRVEGIKVLATMPKLKHVNVMITRGTYDESNAKEAFFQTNVFQRKRQLSLSDVSGVDELLLLRHLDSFDLRCFAGLHSSVRRQEIVNLNVFLQKLVVTGGNFANIPPEDLY